MMLRTLLDTKGDRNYYFYFSNKIKPSYCSLSYMIRAVGGYTEILDVMYSPMTKEYSVFLKINYPNEGLPDV